MILTTYRAEVVKMGIHKAIRLLEENYRKAAQQNLMRPGFIRKPVAYALYQTWREVDAKEEKQEKGGAN